MCCSISEITTDQRGYPRPSSAGTDCDSGAYERFVCNGVRLDGPGAFPGCVPPQESAPDPITQQPTKTKKKKCKKAKKKKGKGKGKRAAASAKKKKCKKKKKKKKGKRS